MNYFLNAVISMSIVIPALLSWLLFHRLNRDFLPFVYQLTLASINECWSMIGAYYGYSNSLNTNIFILGETIIFLWLFWKWRLWHYRKHWYYTWNILVIIAWVFEWYYRGFQQEYFSYCIIIFSFILALMSVLLLCSRLLTIYASLYRDSIFLITTGLIIYFTYAIIFEALWLLELNTYPEIYLFAISIFSIINLFTNLLYFYALLWIPLRRKYIFPSSS